uniref:Epsin 2 n=1 Tax=Lepisosteus oculatus TaxID=7918 RepID=W5MFI7_LEPOC
MPSSSIRRQMKNIVNNYSEAEKKVREATSNDPWGPSSSLMSEIADLTYNVVAFSEIMSMIWKRLNDHGKNWRHVYKALTLLDYLIKTGSERVAQQCKENIFAIQTLKDFQYVDRDGKDQGINVREKSKQLVFLLKDDDRLKGERSQALKTKERMAQVATGVGSNSQIHFGRGSSQPNLSTSYSEEYGRSGGSPASYHGSTSPHASSELEQARPQTSGEEELQLQLALAMSREAAEQVRAAGESSAGVKEERMRRGDDLRLQMALEESRKDSGKLGKKKKEKETDCLPGVSQPSVLMDLMDILPEGPADQTSDPWGGAAAAVAPDPWRSYDFPSSDSNLRTSASSKPIPTADPWGASSASATPVKSADPWGSPAASAQGIPDPWVTGSASHPKTGSPGNFDPFSTLNGTSRDDFSEFDSLRSSSTKTGDVLSSRPSASASPDMFDLQRGSSGPGSMSATTGSRKTPESFLGPNAALVNLDSLVSKPVQPAPVSNPFLMPGAAPPATAQVNPFQVNQPQPPTLNQMRVSPMMGMSSQSFGTMPGMAALAPMGHMVPGMAMSMPGPMPQPLMSTGKASATTAAQGGGTTNPFLL